ncbi:translocase [Tropicibacter oceani]|uniref:Translocase n=1 Tax=Tropicibacter oceani TaxID=3058420 RepID=A0ABY8QK40_9RHOB|nr:translocase [Tropicibacter oceani]WGW04373.1 translocase [Tropicibacter oceani]
MARLKSYLLGGGTLVCALGIGYVMQFGLALPGQGQASQSAPIELSDITLTSSGLGAPIPPLATAPDIDGVTEPVVLAAAQIDAAPMPQPADSAPTGLACESVMEAETTAGAMVEISVDSPCHAGERVTIHHQGMMFTDVMTPDGTLQVTVPALAETATFIAAFTNGEGATATAEVSSLPFYDRVAVQWKGPAGLQLHAREFAAEYFTQGHVWAAEAGDLARAATGEGGFLVRLGQDDAPQGLMVEVYSFPTGTAKQAGDVLMSIEAEVTEANCNTQIEAQTLQLHNGSPLRVGDLTLEMPECDSLGDFLVLKNVVEDLKVAAR